MEINLPTQAHTMDNNRISPQLWAFNEIYDDVLVCRSHDRQILMIVLIWVLIVIRQIKTIVNTCRSTVLINDAYRSEAMTVWGLGVTEGSKYKINSL